MGLNEMVNMTFRCVKGKDLTTFKRDVKLFNIITAMDGKRSVKTIAHEDFYEIGFLAEKINKLVQLGVLEPAYGGGGASDIDPETIKYLEDELANLVGPAGGILLKDTAAKMGHDITSFPTGKIGELLDHVAQFIPDQGKATDLIRTMMARLS